MVDQKLDLSLYCYAILLGLAHASHLQFCRLGRPSGRKFGWKLRDLSTGRAAEQLENGVTRTQPSVTHGRFC